MQLLPSEEAFRVLVAWSEAIEKKHGWVRLDPAEVPGLEGMTESEVRSCVDELTGRGYCTPAAYGDLVYITRSGAKLAGVARDMLQEGMRFADLTFDAIAPRLMPFPFRVFPG